MRNGELLGLQWKDVDLQARTLRVRRTVFNGVASPPKTAAGNRTIRLTGLAVAALKEHRMCEAKQRISEWVFPSRRGTPLSVQNVYSQSWKPLLKRAGLPASTRMHDLRHTCATLLLSRGVPVKVVSEMLGHASVTITLDTCSHVLPNMQEAAAKAMEDALE
jgi:integrase